MPDTVPANPAETADLKPVHGPSEWRGPDMAAHPERWIHRFTDAEIAELEAAAAGAEARGLAILDMTMEDFPIPGFAPRLAAIRHGIMHGHGFHLLRGLPVRRWGVARAAMVFWGMGLHMGEPVSQNGKGHVLGHVKNLGLDYSDPEVRGYRTNARLAYHTDYADIVGLLCLRAAMTGGLSSIVSSRALHNEMLRLRPDLVRELMQPICRDRWGEFSPGDLPWNEVAVFNPVEGGLVTTYVRSAIGKAQRFEAVPRLTAAQVEAMDMLDALSADPAFHLDMVLEEGDVQLVDNHSVLHSRTAYEDRPDPEERRHLLRLWLACEDGTALPESFFRHFQGRTSTGRPSGIHVAGVPLIAPLEAA